MQFHSLSGVISKWANQKLALESCTNYGVITILLSARALPITYLSTNRPAERMGMGLYEQYLWQSLREATGQRGLNVVAEIVYDGSAPVADREDLRNFAKRRQLGFSSARLESMPFALAKTSISLALANVSSRMFHMLDLKFPAPFPGRTLYTVHDLPPLHFSDEGRLASWAPDTAREAKAILVPSEFARSEVTKNLHVDPDKVFVIQCGCDHSRFHTGVAAFTESELAERGLPSRYIVYVGGSTQRKNVTALLNAWRNLQLVYEDLYLVLAGPAETLRRLVESERVSRVVIAGYVDRDTMPRLIKSSRLLVFPSLYEGFGLPPLEAMALGVPVVANRQAGAVPEVVGPAALLTDDGTVEAIRAGIDQVLSDPSMSDDLRRRGPERAREFSWDSHARRVFAVYEAIANPSGAQKI